jgi:UDP-N-acetyl-D-mannosaminuronic acid dehydrogenase
MPAPPFRTDVVVLGGCGHVGLPLAIALADRGLSTVCYDVSDAAVKLVNDGELPFMEPDAQPILERTVASGRLRATTDPSVVADAERLIVVLGTPVDEHLNPDPSSIPRALDMCSQYFRDGQLLVLRSTVYPGVTELVERMVARLGVAVDVAFCPERIAEGKAMEELSALPQIIGARNEKARERAGALFGHLTRTLVHLDPEEAELAKLFTNTYRYIKFATANQLFMIANDAGLDYERIRSAVAMDYPRAADLPRAGFAAGPCLFKDTMQLAAFNDNNFTLGHAAMLVNEGLPLYVVSRMEQRWDLRRSVVGILGMAFKGDSDDTRESLSYKLKRILQFKAAGVLCTDPHVTTDHTLVSLRRVLAEADLLVIGAPHREYRELVTDLPVVDIWNLGETGARV